MLVPSRARMGKRVPLAKQLAPQKEVQRSSRDPGKTFLLIPLTVFLQEFRTVE